MGNLASALRNKMRMLREDAAAVARVVEDAFRGADAVEDDDLDAEMRQLFYDLQDAEVLAVQRREYTCEGRVMRGYTWHVNEAPRLEQPSPMARRPVAGNDVYAELPANVWSSRRRN